MSILLDEYRTKIVNQILFAVSQDEVKYAVDAVNKQLEEYKATEQEAAVFIDAVIHELGLFSPIKKGAQQWSNINLAKILFNRIKSDLNKAVKERY